MTQLGSDNFSRNVVSGPGTASDGQVWAVNAGSSGKFSVVANQLNYAYDAGAYGKLLLGQGMSKDYNIVARFTPGGSTDLFGFYFRYVTANDNVAAGVNQSGKYYVTQISGGVETDYTSVGTVSVTAGTAVWVRVVTTGTQIQIKYWLDSVAEPVPFGFTQVISAAAYYGQYGLIERVGTAATTLYTDNFNAVNATTTALTTLGGYIFPASTDAMTNITDGRRIDIIRPEYWYVGNGTLGTAGVLIEETVAYEPNNGASWGPAGESTTNVSSVKAHSSQQFVTVSGSEWPDGSRTAISALANSSSLLTNFCNTLTTFCTQNKLTGIDLDMELRGGWSTPASATTFTQLKAIISQLGTKLHAAGFKLMIDGPAFTAQGSIKWKWSDFNNLPIDYMNVQAYDNFYSTITGSSANPGPDYAQSPHLYVAQLIAFMKTQVNNINELVIAITAEAYYINDNDTAFSTVSENTGAYGYIDAQGWTGFSGATRDKSSSEMMWTNGGKVYNYVDQAALNAKMQVCLDNGVSNIAIWYIGSSNLWPQPIPTDTSGGVTSGGGGGGGGTGGGGGGTVTSTNIIITNAGLNLLRDALQGKVNAKITYVAVGAGISPPSSTDVRLGQELFRKPVTNYSIGQNPGEVLITMYLSPGDLINFQIQEFGFFAGTATGVANSGTLFARGLYNHLHLNSESIQFSVDIVA